MVREPLPLKICTTQLNEGIMKIELENGFIILSIDENEITIDNIKVYCQKQGTGKKLIELVKVIAKDNNLSIGLYAEPQDETIDEDDLKDFYYACGFVLDIDDCDGKLFIWG